MLPRIQAISIQAFRGIPDLDLTLDGKNVVLKGENATGKSSIVEAFEFFFTGKLLIFEGEGTQSLSLIKHCPHKNFKKEDVSVKISFSPGNIVLERTFETKPKPPTPIHKYFEAAESGTFILRRSQILKFIASAPAQRFQAIASIIGVERLDNIELAFKRACESLQNNLKLKQDRKKSIIESISGYLGKEISSTKQALDETNLSLKAANFTPLASFGEASKISDEFLKTFKESTDLEHVMKLNEIVEELKQFSVDEEITDYLSELNDKLKPFLEEKSRKTLFLADFLSKGQQVIEREDVNTCPFCEQEIDRQRLSEQIKNRLRTLDQLSKEATEIRRLVSELQGKLDSLLDSVEEICKKFEPFDQLYRIRTKLLKTKEKLAKLEQKLKSVRELKVQKEVCVEEFEQSIAMVERLIRLSHTKCGKLFKRIGLSKDWKKKMDVINLANKLSVLVSEFEDVERHLGIEEKQCASAKTIYEAFSEAKKSKMTEIYDSIKGNINSFYSTLHPNEPHKNIEISVAATKRASTELKMESFGSIEDPRAFTSEGHLDSLGLCVFLSFAKKFNKGCSLIVLDDVVTTIDSQHRGLICKLLYEQFKDYQVFITTHDAIWYDQLCASQRAFGISGDCRNMEIKKWTFETGPIVEPYKTRWEQIENKINLNDKSGAANEARTYLEWLLKNVCENIMAQIIFKRQGYTVADFFTPAEARLEKLLEDGEFKQRILQCFQELEATTIMGNLLSHDNPEAENTSIDEVRRFCNAVHELHLGLVCPNCDTFLKYYQDMKRIRCSNGNCKKQAEVPCH